jgi:acetyltransferase-like isoleucine patch superfamily enzyme
MKLFKFFKKIQRRFMSPTRYRKYLINIGVKIGNKGWFPRSSDFGSEPYLIKLGDDVIVGQRVSFITHEPGTMVFYHQLGDKHLDLYGPIVVGNNVIIGQEAMILRNVTIGSNVVIGARSVVTKDLPSDGIYAGIPAKFICTTSEFYEKHHQNFVDLKGMSPKEKRVLLENMFHEVLKD